MNTVANNVSTGSSVPASARLTVLEDALEVIRHHYREELEQAVKTCLGVVASLSLKNRDHCLALVLQGKRTPQAVWTSV